jgi:hypothetical protein
MARRLALLIATYDYQDAGLRRLTAPAHDAQALCADRTHVRPPAATAQKMVRPRQPGSRPERLDI